MTSLEKMGEPTEHEIQKLGFEIIRTGVCSICGCEIISVVDNERIKRYSFYIHARICLMLRHAGLPGFGSCD